MASNGISTLSTKEAKQKAKLDLATTDRTNAGNPRNVYDLDLLPSVYSGNNVAPNPHPSGLILGRPWIET